MIQSNMCIWLPILLHSLNAYFPLFLNIFDPWLVKFEDVKSTDREDLCPVFCNRGLPEVLSML